MKVYVKDWFMRKIEFENRGWLFTNCGGEVVRETEKAYQIQLNCVRVDGEYDTYKTVWEPKTCTLTESEHQAEIKAAEDRFAEGCKKYEELIAKAKAAGVKGVRKGMRAATIKAKIAEAGIEI